MENTISLYGGLARMFERKYDYNPKNIPIKVKSVKEMICALEANFPGFRKMFKKAGQYRITNGNDLYRGKGIVEEEIEMLQGKSAWHIMPVACGCGDFVQVIVGVALIIVGAYTGNPALIKLGIGLTLMGVSQLLAPSPQSNANDNEKPDERPSYLFDGPRNTVEPGLTIPVVYGESFIGSITVSGGVRVMDMSSDISEETEEIDVEEPTDDSGKYSSDNTDKWGSADPVDGWK